MNNQTITGYKFVVVLNKKCEVGKVLNAASHMCLGLMNQVGQQEKEQMQFQDFVDKDGVHHSNISALSLIVLKARNGEIRKLHEQARQQGILHVDFIETMTGGGYVEQLERTKQTATADATYFGIAMFGRIEQISQLTKKLSLWQ